MQIAKKILAVFLAIVLTLSAGSSGIGAFSAAAAGNTFKVGDVISFGNYPQTDVTSSLGSVLNGLGGTWVSYGYYQGNGSEGSMAPANYMFYKDVFYNGDKYRGVKFDTYRPYWTETASTLTCANYQVNNRYYAGQVYWFKFEPIRWRVLDPVTGLVMCATAIDSQAFNSFSFSEGKDGHNATAYWGDSGKNAYANNYAQSSIRQWLINDFYNTAFSNEQKANIKPTELNNNCNSTLNGKTGYTEYDAPSTNDNVFLLSYAEARNSAYGFANPTYMNDSTREIKGSDYAKCQGLYVVTGGNYNGNVWWWLRTPKEGTRYACAISYDGNVNYQGVIGCTGYGVVPAMTLQDLNYNPAANWDNDTFESYKAAKKKAAGDLAQEGDSAACQSLIEAAKNAIDAVTYDKSKSLDQNQAAVDTAANLTKLEADLAAQRADEQLAAYKAAFEDYKTAQKKAANDKSLPGDSDECNRLIENTKEAIDAVIYDKSKSLDQNKAAVDTAANLAQLEADLAEHREIHYAEFYADGTLVDSVPYTIDTKSITEPAVPEKPGYLGTWPAYTLKAGGTRIDAVYTDNTQTVIFDPNGGEGEMESVTTAWGSTITLPECTFTAPNGKAFDKWDAGNPGDEIEVKSDLTVKAIWKEMPLTLTADVDPAQTGDSIAIKVPYAKRGGIAATLTASEDGVYYESSKPDVISVDENGHIRLEKLCLFCKTATITAYSASGEKVATCVVNVKHAWWQYIIWLLLGSFWF